MSRGASVEEQCVSSRFLGAWSNDGRRHEFATHVFKLLSQLALEFSSLVVNQPSRLAKKSNPVFEKSRMCHQTLCLCGVLQASGVQGDDESRTHRIAAVVLCEVRLRSHR